MQWSKIFDSTAGQRSLLAGLNKPFTPTFFAGPCIRAPIRSNSADPRDEARGAQGLPPVPWGDKPWLPDNQVQPK